MTVPSDAEPLFDLITDDGLDAFEGLDQDAPVIPFPMHFGEETVLSTEMTLDELFARMRSGGPHPTTSQPPPKAFADAYRAATRPILVVTVSASLSGTMNAADQGRGLVPEADVMLHDSGTVSAALAFQVHAALTARRLGHDRETAIEWMKAVHEATELYFTLDDLTYLRRGGRIGRVQAAVGGLLDLNPIATVDKSTGTYITAARARSWKKSVDSMAKLVSRSVDDGVPIRVGLVRAEDPAEAERLLERIAAHHPEVEWSGMTTVGAALAVHTGPKAVAYAVAPARWPWESA